MKIIFTFLLFITISAIVHLPISAQSPDKILKKAVQALGDEKVLRKISAKQLKGKIVRPRDNESGDFLLRTSQPNLFSETYDLNGFETAAGFNGKSGWLRDSQNGLRTLTGEASKNFQAEADYQNNLWLNYKRDKSKIAAGGQVSVNGAATNVVSLVNVKGMTIKLYFDAVSGLPARVEIPQASLIYDCSDYRNVDGVQEPFSIVSNVGGERYQIKLDSVIHNQPVAKTVFDFPKISDEPLPDIPSLLKEIQANADRIDNILENYTYTQTNTTRELGTDGIPRDKESETFQITFYKGNRISRLIAKNGKPLSIDEQAKEDRETQNRVAEIEKKIAEKQARATQKSGDETSNEDSPRPSIAEVLRASNLLNPHREQFRGRDVIVFDFEPNPNFDYQNAKSFLKLFGKTAGVIWVDAQDKQVVRLEAVLADNFKIGGGLLANLKKGASFTLENERVNNEVWLPSSADINFSVKVFLVKGFNINQFIKYDSYEKFNSEVKGSKIDEVKKP
ncbi:MAG: hypothetical protein ACR2GD_06685 [Pyrinomonadaceae bacterium]